MYLDTSIVHSAKGVAYCRVLLRSSFREECKVKHRTPGEPLGLFRGRDQCHPARSQAQGSTRGYDRPQGVEATARKGRKGPPQRSATEVLLRTLAAGNPKCFRVHGGGEYRLPLAGASSAAPVPRDERHGALPLARAPKSGKVPA